MKMTKFWIENLTRVQKSRRIHFVRLLPTVGKTPSIFTCFLCSISIEKNRSRFTWELHFPDGNDRNAFRRENPLPGRLSKLQKVVQFEAHNLLRLCTRAVAIILRTTPAHNPCAQPLSHNPLVLRGVVQKIFFHKI